MRDTTSEISEQILKAHQQRFFDEERPARFERARSHSASRIDGPSADEDRPDDGEEHHVHVRGGARSRVRRAHGQERDGVRAHLAIDPRNVDVSERADLREPPIADAPRAARAAPNARRGREDRRRSPLLSLRLTGGMSPLPPSPLSRPVPERPSRPE